MIFATLATPVFATEQIVTLGDSLSFAYEAEFGFHKNIVFYGEVGDGMPATVRNWIEIASARRPATFDLGPRDSIHVSIPFNAAFDLFLRQTNNWAIPGLKIHDLRRFMAGEITFNDIIAASPDFAAVATLLSYSDFNQTTDFNVLDLNSQIQNTAERVTIFIGGNDIRGAYGDIYNATGGGTFVADFMADMTAIVDRVQTLKPNVQVVLANVPHVGITPLVQADFPYDAVKTERVSAVLRDLNGQLAALANSRGIGYADIYGATVSMLTAPNKPIHGVNFIGGSGTANGDLNYVWLNGSLSNNFHPNTNGQALIANEILHAFNKRYDSGIPLLTATEMLVNLSGKTAAAIDIPFATWMTNSGLPGGTAADDSDGDGISAAVEFALGLDPTRNDADYVITGVTANSLDLAYPLRLPSSPHFTLVPESSATLIGGFTPFSTLPTVAADGLYHATFPLTGGKGFLRLKATTP